MALVLMCGFPASGKSKVAADIQRHIESKLANQGVETGKVSNDPKLTVSVVTGESLAGFDRNKTFADPAEEKKLRGYIRSEIQRLLSPGAVVICDSLNYIKGYRYELFCIAKASSASYCVVFCQRGAPCSQPNPQSPGESQVLDDFEATKQHCLINISTNEHDVNPCKSQAKQDTRPGGYSSETLKALELRFEAPIAKNRWDSPLIIVDTSRMGPEEVPAASVSSTAVATCDSADGLETAWSTPKDILDAVYYVVTNKKQRLEPNQSTQCQPLAPTNFLHDLDRLTQDVVRTVMREQRGKVPGDRIRVLGRDSGDAGLVEFRRPMSVPELTRLRRTFLSYMKNRLVPVGDLDSVGSMFVTFINSGNMVD